MKVGDLVRDRDDINHKIFGYGVITRIWSGGMGTSEHHKYATVQFADDVMDMYCPKLVIVNESR